MNSSYLPAADADRVAWLNNFATKIGQYATALGISTTQLTSAQHDASMFNHLLQQINAYKQTLQAYTSLKNQVRSSSVQSMMSSLPAAPVSGPPPALVANGIFNRATALVGLIKQHPAYTPAIGQDLDIIPPVSTINLNDMAPNLSVRIDAGHPLLRWKKGEADGVVIYVDRHDSNGFVLLVHTVKTSYLDITALPPNTVAAAWDYKARYFIGDDEVGLFSPVISVNVVRTV